MTRAIQLFVTVCIYAATSEVVWSGAPLVGVWNVTTTGTEDYTCKEAIPGDTQAYVWILSSTPDGSVKISVQGETSFPKLTGGWDSNSESLLLEGDARGSAFTQAVSWFKLRLEKDGTLRGVRRFISDSQSNSGGPCFADFTVSAKKQ
jgi:hypothetical protein